MAHFYEEPSHTFSEYLLVPSYSSADCIPANVSLRTPLCRFRRGEFFFMWCAGHGTVLAGKAPEADHSRLLR